MKLFLVIIFFLLSFGLWANSRVDSLKSELEGHHSEDEEKVEILNNLGFEYWIINPVQSIIYGQQAKVLAEILVDSAGLAYANRVIGVAHWARGSYDRGLESLLEGLSLYRKLGDALGEANCLMNIGLIYSDRSDDDSALKYYFEALKLFEKVGAKNRSATTYVKLATIFIREEKFDAASDFLGRAKSIHEVDNFEYGLSETLNRYGLLKAAMKQYDSANSYLRHSLEISERIGDLDGMSKTHIDLAEVAFKTNDYAKAEELLQSGLIYAREIQSHKWLKEIYQALQQIARRNGNLEKALVYYDQYLQEKDSIFNVETINNISRLEAELATTEQKRQLNAKEKEILILEQESEIQRTRITILIILTVSICFLAILIIRIRQLAAQRREESSRKVAEEAKKELEFKNRELVSYTINFVQKNQLFEELMESVSEIKKTSTTSTRKTLISMERVIQRHLQIDRDWEDFKIRFENLHSGFFDKILEHASSLTGKDLKLAALVKMNFSIKEISEMMGISTESVKTARYRLKKKLNLPGDMSVNDFINSIS